MKYKLLRFSLFGIFAMLTGLWGNGAWAADRWVKTDPASLQSGDVVAIVDQTSLKAMSNDKGASAAPVATSVTLNGDKSEITSSVGATLQWVVTVTTGEDATTYQFNAVDTEDYLYVTKTNNGLRVGSGERNTFTIVTGGENNGYYLFNAIEEDNRYVGCYNQADWRCYTTINNNIKVNDNAFYKQVKDESDTRVDTSITFGEHATTGEAGTSIDLPTYTVTAGETTVSNATVTWDSSNEDVATIDGNMINLLAAGKTTITATYAGDDTNYKGSSASFQLTVTPAAISITSFSDLQSKVTSTSTPATITFNGEQVVFVNGSNAFLADANGYGALVYTKDHGLEAGQTLTGSINANIVLYQGAAEITGFSSEGLTIGSAEVIPVNKSIGDITIANQSTLVTLKNVTYSEGESDKLLSDGTNSIVYYDKFKTNVVFEEGKAYDITGIVVLYNDKIEIAPRTADDVTEATAEPVEPVTFQDFEITNEQLSGEFDASTLPACATFSGTKRGDSHGYGNVTLTVVVDRPVKFTIGGCQYANPANCKITNAAGEVLATPNLKTATCYHQDGASVTYEYTGEPTTMTFSDIAYLPYFKAEAFEPQPEPVAFEDFEITNEQLSGEFDASTLPACATFSGTKRGDSHGYGNVTLTVVVDRPVKFTIGGCQYANPANCKITNAAGEVLATPNLKTATCYHQDGASVTYEYTGEPTTMTFSSIAYLPYFKAEAIQVEPVAQDITGTWDYADGDIMEATMALSGTSEAGEVEASEENGLKMIVEANGASFRNNGNNIQVRTGAVFKVPVRNAGDLVTVKGYPGYSYYTIGNSTEVITNTQDNPVTTYTAKRSDAEAGYVAITSANDNNYFLSLSVVQYAPKEMITLDNEPATIDFPFGEGTEGQTATFSNADYFLNSKVAHGDGVILEGKDNKGMNQTWFNVTAKSSSANEGNAIRFLFTPKPGFTFTPTKASFTSTRFGTNGGKLDIAWQNPDATTVSLASGVLPNRDSGTNPAIAAEEGQTSSHFSYDINGSSPAEGTCGLLINLYSMDPGKHVGFADIVIEGTLSGTEKEVPILASFKVNGTEYAAEDVFGELYEATLELKNSETMVSAENPLTDVTAASGEVGELTYEGTDTQCKVTIPLTAADTQMDYVLNVIYKPFCTLEYVGVDGTTVLKTQTVEKDAAIGEFACNIAEVPATKEGYKARGWFKTGVLGEKFTTADVITANTKLYAIQTEIEEASTHKKYIFDLTDKFFYAEDHEAFNPAGEGFYWHDAQHGWAFKNGNTVDLLVGPKATITVTLCQYGSATGIAVKKGGETLATIDGIADGDGGTSVFNYEGEAGTLTLEMQCGGEMYIHGIKIVNTAEVNFESQDNWYFVKAGDASSLIDVLDVVNGINASRDAARSFIFLPDGTYDLGATVKTAITGHNISLIGQSMDNTIIVTTPDKSIEGLGKADLLDVSGTNLYMQDLTLQNALDYYNAGSAGRAAVLQDAGNRTIGKNVRMLSHQDTYYSSSNSQQAYWETCDIHGTVDFICGGGDIRFQNTTISLEPRALNGTGSRTITAPTTNTQFGYVFDGCTVVDLANGNGEWNFGRTWQNQPVCVFLNTKLDNNAKNTLIGTRWIEKGMNNVDPKVFGEYNTMDAAGNNITPESNTINSHHGTFQTILTAEEAAGFAYDKMFTDWDPMTLATQVEAPSDAKYENGKVTWSSTSKNASACALFKNGVFAGLTEGFSLDVQIGDNDVLTLRAANSCGGLGEPVTVTVATGIDELATEDVPANNAVYNMQGVRVEKAQKGLYIINGKKVVVK